jgi:uncharacterized protein
MQARGPSPRTKRSGRICSPTSGPLSKQEVGREPDMGIAELLQSKREDILRIAAKHGAREVRVFGSVARGDARPESDVDFLVEFEPGRSLLDHAGLLLELEQLLGREVDVVTNRGLRHRIRERVLREAVLL